MRGILGVQTMAHVRQCKSAVCEGVGVEGLVFIVVMEEL